MVTDVQQRQTTSNGVNTVVLSFLALPTLGNALVVICTAWNSGTVSFPSNAVTDNQGGNVWTQVVTTNSLTNAIGAFVCVPTISAGTFTITLNGSGTADDMCIQIYEKAGNEIAANLINGTPVSATITSGTTPTTGAIVTTVPNTTIVCAICGHGSIEPSYTAGTNFTMQQEQTDNSGTVECSTEERDVSSTGSYTGSFTASIAAGAAAPYYMVAFALAAAAVAAVSQFDRDVTRPFPWKPSASRLR